MSDIEQYIKTCRSQGQNDETIKKNLLDAGWHADMLQAYFPSDPVVPKPSTPPLPPAPTKSFWDTFEGIVMNFCLLFCIYALLTLIVYGTQFYFASDKISRSGDYSDFYQKDTIYYLAAVMVVTYPVLAFTLIDLKKKALNNPLLKNSFTHSILNNLIMIVLFFVVIYYAIMTVFNFFTGALTKEFLVQMPGVVGVCILVFTYLFLESKQKHA